MFAVTLIYMAGLLLPTPGQRIEYLDYLQFQKKPLSDYYDHETKNTGSIYDKWTHSTLLGEVNIGIFVENGIIRSVTLHCEENENCRAFKLTSISGCKKISATKLSCNNINDEGYIIEHCGGGIVLGLPPKKREKYNVFNTICRIEKKSRSKAKDRSTRKQFSIIDGKLVYE